LAAGLIVALSVAVAVPAFAETRLDGHFTQGGLILGLAAPGSTVMLDGRPVRVSKAGRFVLGFSRDAPPEAALVIIAPDRAVERRRLAIAPRAYDIQRIDGLPRKMVTPPAAVLARIRRENAEIKRVRQRDTAETLFESGFVWPARGRISGVYGSRRILNGTPRRPHYGIDVAAPVGTPVAAPAAGIVVLAEPDLYYTGGTIILDHGHGLTSAFLHMAKVTVTVGDRLRQGDPMGTIGATGRATGPHLDWRMNWFDRRLDPGLLMGPMD
jgi:murein DD-endopeptidase MepM/ murein hydrolase activator NlpD